MLGRALILAAVTFAFGCFATLPASAQNLEAGKPPSQIFSSTCSLCHKSARGLLKSVGPGSLPGFLRQHYTTSTDMASAMSAYVLSNGAANAPVAGGNLTRQGQEAKSGPKPSAGPDDKPEQASKGRKPPTREAARPDADGLQTNSGEPAPAGSPKASRQKAAKGKAAKDEPPKDEARFDPSRGEPPKDETAKPEGTRPDPVPAVTPAPSEPQQPADTAAVAPPKEVVLPTGPLTIDRGPVPAPPKPSAAVASGPPAGPPIPPISQ